MVNIRTAPRGGIGAAAARLDEGKPDRLKGTGPYPVADLLYHEGRQQQGVYAAAGGSAEIREPAGGGEQICPLPSS